MANTNNKKDLIINNKYNNIIINENVVIITKTKKYKKKSVKDVKTMSIEKYLLMLKYPNEKTYIKTQKTYQKEKI